MSTTFNLLFYLKKRSNHQCGPVPVYLRITVNGKRSEISIQRDCLPDKWDSRAGRMMGTKEDAKILNAYLNTIQARIYEIHRELVANNDTITADLIRAKYTGAGERPRLLIEIFKHHNKQFEELVGKEFSAGTFKKYKSCLASLYQFVLWKFNKPDIDIKIIGFDFVKDYEFYLKSVQNMQHNTAMGNIKKLKKIIRQCAANEWIKTDPFRSYKITTRETHRNFLLPEELEILKTKKIAVDRLIQVRDIFLFACYTGLSYADVMLLKPQDISVGIDGEQWIFTNRIKTDTATRIPVLPIARDILEKYKSHPDVESSGRLLPKLSNQRLNSYLKEITSLCGFKKELTFHCARHTFATTVTLSNGVPIETVSKMLGHKNLRTTQLYAKIVDRKVSEDMQVLKNKFNAQVNQKAI